MTDLQAALGIHQLARLDGELRRRAEIWDRYDDALESLPVDASGARGRRSGTRPAAVLRAGARPRRPGDAGTDVLNELLRLGIGAGVHFAPVHLHPYYREAFGHREGDLPNAERLRGAHAVAAALRHG